MAGVKAFNQESFATDTDNAATFESRDARLLRYAVNQAYYDNLVFSNIHSFAAAIKRKQPALYKYIQNVYNPAYRLAETYRMNVWGGLLDPQAGDIGAIPIAVGEGTDEDAIRKAIAYQWIVSNWMVNKAVLPLNGAVLGDCAIIVRDLPEKELARIEVLHPSSIADVEIDNGIVKSYFLLETRLDNDGKAATYGEKVERGDGEDVIFSTFKNDKPYAWNDNKGADGVPRQTWTEPYGFIPLVLIQHDNCGLKWGKAEGHTLLPKINGVEDLASALHDHIRRAQAGMGLLAGVDDPGSPVEVTGRTPTTDKQEPGREENNMLYSADPAAHYDPMVFPLDIASVSAEIQNRMSGWKEDYPELRSDIWQADSRVEGVRAAREQVEAKIIERRAAYDAGLVRALQMVIAIGGFRKYKGFEGFDLTSFKAGKMNFSISARPVFKDDPAQKFKDVPEQITALSELRSNNPGLWPDSFYQAQIGALYGMSEDEIEEMASSAQDQTQRALDELTGASGRVAAGTGSTDTPPPSNIESEKGLNGAQITAAVELLKNVSAGVTAPGVATELLISLGIDEVRVKKMVDAAKAISLESDLKVG